MELFMIVILFVVVYMIVYGWISGRSQDRDFRIMLSVFELALAYGFFSTGEIMWGMLWLIIGGLGLLLGLTLPDRVFKDKNKDSKNRTS